MNRCLLFVPINFLVAGILTFCVNSLTANPWRKAAAAHWTERARLLWPVRTSGAVNIWLIPRFTFGRWLRLVAMTWSIRAGSLGVLVLSALLMPDEFGLASVVVGGSVLAYLLALHFGLYLRFLRWWKVLVLPDRRLRSVVARTAQRMGLREPGTWLLDAPLAQAFALPATGELMFSSRLLDILTDDEISAVCAHEMGHLTESKSVLAGRIAGSMALYPLIFLRPAAKSGPLAICAIGVLVVLSAMLNRKLSRRMETRADKIATENQVEQGLFAGALEKLYCDNLIPAVSTGKRKAHPHLYDRMLAAGIQPDYPRPAKPQSMRWSVFLISIALGVLIGRELRGDQTLPLHAGRENCDYCPIVCAVVWLFEACISQLSPCFTK